MSSSLVNADSSAIQILTFILDDAWYGLDISHIHEVIEYKQVTKVPRSSDFMLGVFNLRGQVVPVIDLRRYFDLETCSPTIDSCIIIVELLFNNESIPIGLLADKVDEVVEFTNNQLEPAPKLGNKIDRQFIQGIVEHENNFVMILKLDKVFSEGELKGVIELPPEVM